MIENAEITRRPRFRTCRDALLGVEVSRTKAASFH